MTGTQVMVLLIVAMVMLASIIKSKHGYRHRHVHRHGGVETETIVDGGGRESTQLREEVRQLKERLAVLEQITIEKENSLSREIERLRDR